MARLRPGCASFPRAEASPELFGRNESRRARAQNARPGRRVRQRRFGGEGEAPLRRLSEQEAEGRGLHRFSARQGGGAARELHRLLEWRYEGAR